MKTRLWKNNIVGLLSGDQMIEVVEGDEALAFSHFHDRFQESAFRRPYLDGVLFNSLSYDDRETL